MRNYCFLLFIGFITTGIYAEEYPRLMDSPKNQIPIQGQSIISFTINLGSSDRSAVVSVDEIKIGHYFNEETVEIAVSDGKHVIRASQMIWDTKNKGWRDHGDDRITETLKGEKLPVSVQRGTKMITGRTTKLSFSNSMPATQSSARAVASQGSKPGIEGAVARASIVFIGELPKDSTIAVISISSNDLNLATFAVDELEYQLVTAKQFTIVDRKTLDTIRTEQNFQLSGEVSDQSAISIGNLLGAGIVITGSVSGTGNTQRLTLKALNVKTAQIITMARESF